MSAKGVGLTFLWKLLEFPAHELPNGGHIIDAFMGSFHVVLDEPCIDLLLDDCDGLGEVDAFAFSSRLENCSKYGWESMNECFNSRTTMSRIPGTISL